MWQIISLMRDDLQVLSQLLLHNFNNNNVRKNTYSYCDYLSSVDPLPELNTNIICRNSYFVDDKFKLVSQTLKGEQVQLFFCNLPIIDVDIGILHKNTFGSLSSEIFFTQGFLLHLLILLVHTHPTAVLQYNILWVKSNKFIMCQNESF